MLKRTLFFTNPAYISTRQEQLKVALKNSSDERLVPIEDIGFVILEHPQITITLPAMQKLNDHNVALICCNHKHHPAAMLLNLDGHHLQGELFRQQIDCPLTLKKQLWQQTIRAKIKNQAALLKKLNKPTGALPALATSVLSNDSSNREGTAAREYWKQLFGAGFIRDRYGAPPNPFLNYGYILLRAAVARSLTSDVTIGQVKRPLMVALSYTTASLARCFSGEEKQIRYPVF